MGNFEKPTGGWAVAGKIETESKRKPPKPVETKRK